MGTCFHEVITVLNLDEIKNAFLGAERNIYGSVGIYGTAEAAARAYDEVAIEYHGPDALTNEKLGNFK